MRLFFALILALAITGCATSGDVRNAPLTAGISKTYDAPYNTIKRLALESLQGLNVDVKSTNEVDGVYSIMFSKAVSAFSWGEVGRVAVVDMSPETSVSVVSEKRAKFQITGTNEEEFANQVFDGIDHALDQ